MSQNNPEPRRRWWPFWCVLAIYVPIRLVASSPGVHLVAYVVAVFDPVMLAIAIVLGLAARKILYPKHKKA